MGKVLRVLVILLAILSIAAIVFAYKNYNKREILIGRAHLLEDMFVKVASTLEAEDIPETQQPSYPQLDISAVTSREIENPERSAFWDEKFEHKYDISGTTPPRLELSDSSHKLQLRTYYHKDGEGKYEIDPLTGKPSMKGPDTMSTLLDQIYDRAKVQYNVLNKTRDQVKILREELVNTIEIVNSLKQEARTDKRTIEVDKATIGELERKNGDLESKIRNKEEEIQELNEKVNEKDEEIDKQKEEIQGQKDDIKRLQEQILVLKGNRNGVPLNNTQPALADGVLTPGDKGKIVAVNDEWKFAVIEFSSDFVTELVGPDRSQPLPLVEVMVRRPGIDDPDAAFVTRLKLRQIIREKNLVIADILADWQQKPVAIGDVVFN